MSDNHKQIECGLAVIHPWLCDAMGHLSTRNYVGIFDDACHHLFLSSGYDPDAAFAESWGWADVRQEIEYRSEITAGSLVRVVGRITAMGRSSVTSVLHLLDRPGGRLCAILTARTVCFDLAARQSRPLPGTFVKTATELFSLDTA